MEQEQQEQQELFQKLYNYTANLIINEGKSTSQAKLILIEQGINEETASILVDKIDEQIKESKNKSAKKDMIYGGLWCVGGLIGTLSGIGLVFWGAILFGAFQFFRGVGKFN